ncbi:hypothetical protein D9619_011300 [Psilocybe cf. subviscida]|uniref:Uncharacterized protein n=1 Tax=Psilocybe cf. subviscida TaxID=2480587 RepID=A0A8H5BIR4_9AGAR|nr:hypothetical protein D9619_011300 [Psilocybe cf. subviscida]
MPAYSPAREPRAPCCAHARSYRSIYLHTRRAHAHIAAHGLPSSGQCLSDDHTHRETPGHRHRLYINLGVSDNTLWPTSTSSSSAMTLTSTPTFTTAIVGSFRSAPL